MIRLNDPLQSPVRSAAGASFPLREAQAIAGAWPAKPVFPPREAQAIVGVFHAKTKIAPYQTDCGIIASVNFALGNFNEHFLTEIGNDMLTWTEIETRAIAFQKHWRDCTGDERQDAQTFEKDFMYVFGVDWHDGLHEHPIISLDGVQNYIDYLLPGKILIEMKSRGKSLDAAFTQAMQYLRALKPEDQPALVVVSDFDTIKVYNTSKQHHYKAFKVSNLKSRVRIFSLLTGHGAESEERTEIEVNTDASYKMAKLHDALKENGYTGHELEVYLVRLLFCLFADDTGVFEKRTFYNYLQASNPDGSDLSGRLTMLFSVLDTPDDKRMKNLPEELKRFRYINGNLFSERLAPPFFSAKMRSTLLECCDFDWTQISPAIFGAMFQGVMNPQERRELGAHYTSRENILKVIQPLFLDALYEEFERSKNTTAELQAFHKKISSLTFLDPACGCGNFLIVTYEKLRELEFEILKLLAGDNQMVLFDASTKVSINQFYGIEIEEFPCEIAKVSMLLMKHLMDQEVSHYFGGNFIDYPIRDNVNIVNANALRIDWSDVVPAIKLNYIMGNPPFVGYGFQSKDQKKELQAIYTDEKGLPFPNSGKIDYVSGWFCKAAKLMKKNPDVKSCFVATNSICQGDQVEPIWKPLHQNYNIEILFAYNTFRWNNEAKFMAAVYCIIVGFGVGPTSSSKLLYQNLNNSNREPEWKTINVPTINFYLSPAHVIFIPRRSSPIFDVPPMISGNRPTDGGHLIIESDQIEEFIRKQPDAKKYIKPFIGAREFLHNESRYCLWLVGADPKEINRLPLVKDRVRLVKETRQRSPDKGARDLAFRPTEFRETNNPQSAIIVPRVTSENRLYVPIGFIGPDVISGDQNMMIPDASIYEFGVITSSTHMAWMRTVAGRLEMRYRYSAQIVYNNFPWPNSTTAQKEKIEQTAQAILDARQLYPEASLADLYDELTMPPELRKAHIANDKAVWEAYGKAWPLDDEPACVAHLMRLYQQLTADETQKEKNK